MTDKASATVSVVHERARRAAPVAVLVRVNRKTNHGFGSVSRRFALVAPMLAREHDRVTLVAQPVPGPDFRILGMAVPMAAVTRTARVTRATNVRLMRRGSGGRSGPKIKMLLAGRDQIGHRGERDVSRAVSIKLYIRAIILSEFL